MQDALKSYILALQKKYATEKAGEHSYRPAMQTLLEKMIPKSQAINEPKQTQFGAPDFEVEINGVPVGHIEAKDIEVSLDDEKNLEQVERYAEHLGNLIYTDYLTFRLIRKGKQVSEVRIAEMRAGKIKSLPANFAEFSNLMDTFAEYKGKTIKSADDLAKRMAHKARRLAKVIADALPAEVDEVSANVSDENKDLQGQLQAFRKHLIHDIKSAEFADIYAQTIAYGMFAARLHDPLSETFTRHKAADLIPTTNPFLRKFFQQIAGYDLDKRISWIVDDLAALFRATDVGELMKDHGRKTARTDPFIHFYETFLGEYDPKKRKSRGVYYTPEPVVDFIVRAVDDILREQFGLDDGIAAKTKTTIPVAGVEQEIHKVQILDPATGTGTFLAAIVKHIRETYYADQKGMWPDYVTEHLIPRLNGFEVLMASYAMAHIKLDMVLRENGGKLSGDRVNVFLTNTLEEHHTDTETLFARWLSEEAEEANRIKRDTPVMVVIGNPPYAVNSSNKGDWINNLIADYKKDLNERKLNLDDDYIKFIRYGEHLVRKTGTGILAYISNNSFLDGITHRQMRKHLLETFDEIYILDLHGNARKKETTPDGSPDKNVFDIMQGVSINLFVKTGKKKDGELANVFHHDLYGERESKYQFLWDNSLDQIKFQKLTLPEPYYFFVPKDYELQSEYESGFSMYEFFSLFSSGVKTERDSFTIYFTKDELRKSMSAFRLMGDEEAREKFSLRKDSRDWKIHKARKDLEENVFNDNDTPVPICYRPFDVRYTYYTGTTRGFHGTPGHKAMKHILARDNFGLLTSRFFSGSTFDRIFVTKNIPDIHSASDQTYFFPLYYYHQPGDLTVKGHPPVGSYLAWDISHTIADDLGLTFVRDKETDHGSFGSIDLMDYIYAVLYSPAYREKYKEFLKIDFPRVPYPTDKNKFRRLVELGGQLRALHLMESKKLNTFITGYPEAGDNLVAKPEYQITDFEARRGKVKINKKQYFSDVPESAWNFYIGGYQPAQKWLKDRKGRTLNNDDLEHYQKIIVALWETEKLMAAIDETIDTDGPR